MTDEQFSAEANFGDELGKQSPAACRADSQKEMRRVQNVRENTPFSEISAILENDRVAAEGLEQPRETRGKHGFGAKGEAKPDAVFSGGVANVPALADWLADHLDDFELAELVRELDHRAIER
jgi:hypothetical protein